MESEIVGAVLFIAGMVFGRTARLRARKTYKPKVTQPICGCGHHFSLHDPKTKACHGSFDSWNDPINKAAGASTRGCGCRQYSGPTPLPEYYAPEIGSTA